MEKIPYSEQIRRGYNYLAGRVNELKTEVNELETENEKLKAENAKLKAELAAAVNQLEGGRSLLLEAVNAR